VKPPPDIPARPAQQPQAGLWVLGLGVSVCAHLAALAALMPFLDPDPLPQQPSPQSALTMESQAVTRSQAQEQAATPDPGRQVPAQGDSLEAGAVQETTARTSAPALLPVPPASAQGDQLASLAPLGLAAAVQAPDAQATPARPLASQPTPVRPATTQPVSAQRPDLAVTQAQVPAVNTVSAAALELTTASQTPTQSFAQLTQPSAAPTQAMAETAATPQQAAESPPQSEEITAALAFQGDGTKDLDPTSIAAFQSFTRPGDPGSQAADLRDGLAGLLGAVPCSRLQVVFDPETATLELRGHLPEDGLRQPVLAALQAQMGRDIVLSDKMRLLPRPQCGALSGISTVGLPQSTDQITNPLLLGADAQARVLSYSGGEQLYFDLTAPDYPAYLYVDFFDAAGDVIHLSPNAHIPLKLAEPKSALRVGAKTPEDPGLQITVGPPYGQEIAVAFAASSPLYEGLRPLNEPAPAYLDFLRQRVADKRGQDIDFKGEWVYFLIETQAK
jgi:hypothetical protein